MKSYLLGFVAVATMASASFAAPVTRADAARANNEFGFNLFNAVTKRTEKGNKFLSPVSAYLALSMALNGATGTTLDEIERTLAVSGLTREDINAANQELLRTLVARRDGYQLSIANSLWARKGFDLKASFVEQVGRAYQARLSVLDFASPAASKEINTWVSDKTNGRIPSIVKDRLDPALMMLLINATYFKAKWASEFKNYQTHMRKFEAEAADGSTRSVDVPMMAQTASFHHRQFEDGTEAIELPYLGHAASMIVVMPPKGRPLAQFEENGNAAAFDALVGALSATRLERGLVVLPKLEFTYEDTLNSALQSLGMKRAFSDRAQFENLTRMSVMISQVLQKTYIGVNEEGTEAAAATSIGISVTSVPAGPSFKMIVDRPYVFAIRDNSSGAVLFLGSVKQPEGGKMPLPPKKQF